MLNDVTLRLPAKALQGRARRNLATFPTRSSTWSSAEGFDQVA
jgi:hypothetical protein